MRVGYNAGSRHISRGVELQGAATKSAKTYCVASLFQFSGSAPPVYAAQYALDIIHLSTPLTCQSSYIYHINSYYLCGFFNFFHSNSYRLSICPNALALSGIRSGYCLLMLAATSLSVGERYLAFLNLRLALRTA